MVVASLEEHDRSGMDERMLCCWSSRVTEAAGCWEESYLLWPVVVVVDRGHHYCYQTEREQFDSLVDDWQP